MMRWRFPLVLAVLVVGFGAVVFGAEAGGGGVTVETLVFLRHGERPYGGMGQMTEQGLRRAVALPEVLERKFGRPDYLFAPSPLAKVTELDTGKRYYYLRPLATIEPTAIRWELPVDVGIGYRNIGALRRELERPKYWGATVFIAWEHLEICKVVREILGQYRVKIEVPEWAGTDFDSLYVVRIARQGGRVTGVSFRQEHQGLNGVTARGALRDWERVGR